MAKRSTAKTKKVMVEPERAVLYSGNVLLLQMERGREENGQKRITRPLVLGF